DGEHVQTDLFGLHRDLDDRLDPLRFTGCDARDRIAGDVADREDTELHHSSRFPPSSRVSSCVCIYLNRGAPATIPDAPPEPGLSLLVLSSLGVAPQDAELIALGIGHDVPAGAGTMDTAPVGDEHGA